MNSRSHAVWCEIRLNRSTDCTCSFDTPAERWHYLCDHYFQFWCDTCQQWCPHKTDEHNDVVGAI